MALPDTSKPQSQRRQSVDGQKQQAQAAPNTPGRTKMPVAEPAMSRAGDARRTHPPVTYASNAHASPVRRHTPTNGHHVGGQSPHDTRQQPGMVSFTCVYCENRDPATGQPIPLAISVEDTHGPSEHIAYIQPCGHLAGWSCMKNDARGYCPRCGIIWRRDEMREGHCAHIISLSPLRADGNMTPDQTDWLVPQVPGGYVPRRCRLCATQEALRSLTQMARAEVSRMRGAGDTSCLYATDGVVHGFLEGDSLKPFAVLEVAVKPPLLSGRVVEEARRMEQQIRTEYEGVTPTAESKRVGRMPFEFKIGAALGPFQPHSPEPQRNFRLGG